MGGYKLVNAQRGQSITVSTAIAKQISVDAFYFYWPLPAEIHTLKEFLGLALAQVKNDFWMFTGAQLLISLLILTAPLALSYLFNVVVPNYDFLLLGQVSILLFTILLIMVLFYIAQTVVRIRLRFKLDAIISPAIWDKILKFPLRFFRRFSAGDIAFRANLVKDMQINFIQSLLSLTIGGLTLISLLILMFYYSRAAATAAIVQAIVICIVVLTINYRQLTVTQRLYDHYGRLVNLVFELIIGISKIRVNNAMSRVFSLWLKLLLKRSQTELRMKFYQLGMEVFIALMLVVNLMILYALTVRWGLRLTFGDFVALNTAYGLFFMTLLIMIGDLSAALRIAPQWQQSKAIFASKIESERGHSDPGELSGDIRLNNIDFRYHAYDQPLFKNLSLAINPGEFIAIVGPSGSGKSTLFRLILGFEEPEAGDVYFNGLNLRSLKLSAVRRQIGVVIQSSTLIPGTIFANIAGNSTKMTRLEAWEVAKKVGLAEFIKFLPMQMDTLITEGVTHLSGGEAQRLILARALAQKPKIIVLDEATSALDNTTQAVVHSYLKQLHATQIVAAHRLSTVMNADRILVIDKGEIIQAGTFAELMRQPGLFAQMAQRQL